MNLSHDVSEAVCRIPELSCLDVTSERPAFMLLYSRQPTSGQRTSGQADPTTRDPGTESRITESPQNRYEHASAGIIKMRVKKKTFFFFCFFWVYPLHCIIQQYTAAVVAVVKNRQRLTARRQTAEKIYKSITKTIAASICRSLHQLVHPDTVTRHQNLFSCSLGLPC